jgi:hypothetical protein
LQTKVPLPSGGYLYIQPTEALAVIDVNSGKFTSLQSQAETIKLTNLEACKEIARQLRLRNVGGMIIVDFIDMESRANQLQVLQTFENELAPDKAKPQIGQLSDLGLVEMTRHRQGQSLSEIFTRRCHSCSGTGHALEEFSWMHPGGDGEGRGRQSGRNKLPVRQPNRMQQVPKPAASVHQRKDKGRVLNQLGGGDGAQQRKEPQSAVTPGNILLNRLAEKKQNGVAAPVEPQETLVEHFSDKILKNYGIRFAAVTKLSFMPPPINSVLSRINPKANDIVSLVHSIESSPEPMSSRLYESDEAADVDLEGDEGPESEGDEETEAVAEAAVATSARPSTNGRHGRGQRPPRPDRDRRPLVRDREMERNEEAEPETDEAETRQELLEFEVPEVEDTFAESDDEEEEEPAPVAEKPVRRGRPAVKRQEESVDDLEVLQNDASDDDNDDEELDSLDDDDDDDIRGTDDGDDDDSDSDDDEEAEGNGSAVAIAPAGAQAKRRRGRPAKRSIKKPPAKR